MYSSALRTEEVLEIPPPPAPGPDGPPALEVRATFVQSTTMNNVRVESCVVGAVKRWPFPKPTGGGIAIVSYPFNFVSGGGN